MASTTKDQFLNSILAQIDMKVIDWNIVAQKNNLRDAKAAYKRFWAVRNKLEKEIGTEGGSPQKARATKRQSPKKKSAAAAAIEANTKENEEEQQDGEGEQ
ncbi:hypothetical protein KEM55_001914 [Ascosphaera atra]|nr:hypothetical protein KEM55_001914 [Ascosphaera atra]